MVIKGGTFGTHLQLKPSSLDLWIYAATALLQILLIKTRT